MDSASLILISMVPILPLIWIVYAISYGNKKSQRDFEASIASFKVLKHKPREFTAIEIDGKTYFAGWPKSTPLGGVWWRNNRSELIPEGGRVGRVIAELRRQEQVAELKRQLEQE